MRVISMVDGKPKALTPAELGAVIKGRSGRNISDANMNACANAILGHPGGNAAGGAIGGFTYKGASIYHFSRNRPVNNGCTVFFADSGSGVAKLLAVGRHSGQGPNGPVYELDWVSSDWGTRWRAGGRVTLE